MTKETILSNPNILIGMTLGNAVAYIAESGLQHHIVEPGEIKAAIFNHEMVNLDMEDNRVKKVWIG